MIWFFFTVGFVAFLLSLWFRTTDCYKAFADSIYMMRYGLYTIRCEHCKRWETAFRSTVRIEASRTLYEYKGKECSKDNPNRPQLLCCCCAEMHHDYWDEMWTDYYGSTTGYHPEYPEQTRCKHTCCKHGPVV